MNPTNPRDYGLGDGNATLSSVPRWHAPDSPMLCPDCKARIVVISVRVAVPQLHGGGGTGKYLGCPACTWVSPMLAVSDRAPSVPELPAELLKFAVQLRAGVPHSCAAPEWLAVGGSQCPCCACAPVMRVTPVSGVPFYGCPACSWAGVAAGQTTFN